MRPTGSPGRRRSGSGREEMGISSDIRAAVIDDLTFDPDVDASDIRVEEMDGDVVLTGSVPSYPQYVQAAAVAARAVGVRCVRNHLQVALPPGDHRDDLTLAAMANDALTRGGGTEREAAEAMVAELTGVCSVRNDIQILDRSSHERLARDQSRDR